MGFDSSESSTEAVCGGRWPGMKDKRFAVLVGAEFARREFSVVGATSKRGFRWGRPVDEAA